MPSSSTFLVRLVAFLAAVATTTAAVNKNSTTNITDVDDDSFRNLLLTPENYFAATRGKSVFVMFMAPWCGHSKRMKPDWEQLAKEFEGNADGLIAAVDCEGEGKSLCDKNNVQGFPTLKYGDPFDLEEYNGARTLKDLKEFAKQSLKPACSPTNLDACDADSKKLLKKLQKSSKEQIEKRIKEEEKQLRESEKQFEAAVTKLQDDYHRLAAEKDAKIADIQSSDLRLLRSMLMAKNKESAAKDEL